jgi:hypothetical protein
MPLDFIEKYLLMRLNFPWGTNLTEVWIRNIGFYAIFLDDSTKEGATLTVGTSIWNLIHTGDP